MALTASELTYILSRPSSVADAASLPLTKTSLLADVVRLKEDHGDCARAVVEVALARRSVTVKFGADRAAEWLMDSESAQQATLRVVAEFRAAHLADLGITDVLDVTCSIGTELAATVAEPGIKWVLGGDLDPQRVRMAQHNVPEACSVVMDALRPAVASSFLRPGAVVLADPARRNSSGRVTTLADLRPRLEDLWEVYGGAGVDMAVKCAPGIDYSDAPGQVDIISVAGGVKEACLYTPGISQCGRRAVMLEVASEGEGRETVDDTMPEQERIGGVGEYIVDPDGAVVRAGLVRHYGARHGLWQLDERIAYLTGPKIPRGRRGFRVLDQVPLKQVRKALVARGVGAVEILVRGVDVNPDELRKKWKLKGSLVASVVITRIGDKAWAFICSPERG